MKWGAVSALAAVVVFAILGAWLISGCGAGPAPAPAAAKSPLTASAREEAAIETVVGKRLTDCEIAETPFPEVVRYFSQREGIPMSIDDDVLAENRTLKVSFKFKGEALAKVLRTLAVLSGSVAEPDGAGIRFRKEGARAKR